MSTEQEHGEDYRDEYETGEGRQQDLRGKARVRRSKKPEIQLYRPGALRSLRSTASGEQITVATESESLKAEGQGEAREEGQKNEVARKSSTKGRQERKKAREDGRGERRSPKEAEYPKKKETETPLRVAHPAAKNEKSVASWMQREEPQCNSKPAKDTASREHSLQHTGSRDLPSQHTVPRKSTFHHTASREHLSHHTSSKEYVPHQIASKEHSQHIGPREPTPNHIPSREHLSYHTSPKEHTSHCTASKEQPSHHTTFKEHPPHHARHIRHAIEAIERNESTEYYSKQRIAEDRIGPLPPDDRSKGGKTTVIINNIHNEGGEKSTSMRQKAEEHGNRSYEKNEKNSYERKTGKREEKGQGKPCERQSVAEVLAKTGSERSHSEKVGNARTKKSSPAQRSQNSRGRGSREHDEWTQDADHTKQNKRNTPEKGIVKMEKSPQVVNVDMGTQGDQLRVRGGVKAEEGEGRLMGSRYYINSDRYHFEGDKTETGYRETHDQNLKRENSRGTKWHQKMHEKAFSEPPPEVENIKSKEDASRSVLELAAKVDKLAVCKIPEKIVNLRKKGKGCPENQSEVRDSIHRYSKKGIWHEDQASFSLSESPEKFNATHRDEGKTASVNVVPKETPEKTQRVKSYSNARESRRKRASNKIQSPGSQKENLKIEVTVNKDTHERIPHLIHRTEPDAVECVRVQEGQETPSDRKSEVSSSNTQRGSVSHKNKANKYNKTTGGIQGEKLVSGRYDSEDEVVENMKFIDVPEDDWSQEVERDTTWCNQPEGKGRLQVWEDEKLSWRTRRVKHHSDGEEPHQRVESPGRRGGLIQLSAAEPPGPEPVSSQKPITTPPVIQKHLYNPNNPSKPVAVVPSARDLPLTREVQRGQNWGSPGEGVAGSTFSQGSQVNECPMESSSTKVDPSLLYNISKGEMDINYYVSSNQLPVEFRRIMDIRMHLQGCYRQLLLSDIRTCHEKNIEGSLWKTLYYTIIEKLREYISREASLKERSMATLRMLVEEGLRYLQELLEALQQEYGFTLEDYLEEEGEVRGRVKMALLSAQKLLLSLGDLARYREQYNATHNYITAKKWYQMALQVYPRNGRPFNQLAIIALSQKRPLDVVYFYIRSLTASNPIMSARDSLVAMFDDIRKRYASAQRSDPHPEGTRANLGRSVSHEGLRQELWIRPDSGATNCRTLSHSNNEDDSDKDEDLRKLSKEQLMKQFLASYLHCQGMLFSGVGLDLFRNCCVNMLREFSLLLHTSPPLLSTSHLLQIMAINMYAITNTEVKDVRVGGSGYRSAAQDLALVLAQEMMGRLVGLVVELMPHHINFNPNQTHPQLTSTTSSSSSSSSSFPPAAADSDTQRLFSPTLAHYMPPLKAWCDWLLYHSPVWNPPPAARDYAMSEGDDTWSSVARLATLLRGVGPPDVTLTQATSPTSDLQPLRLTEDTFLRGYEPLLAAHAVLTFAPSVAHTGRARDWARVLRLQTCLCQFLCGVDPPVLRLQKTEKGDVLVSLVDTSPAPSPAFAAARGSFSGSDVEVEDSQSDSEVSDGGEEDPEVDEGGGGEGGWEEERLSSTVQELTRRKKMLERKQRRQNRLQDRLEGSVTLEMEVRPRYLVPDTNCFIEHLDVVQDLASGPYTVMVPLVVLNELDGLSRDAVVAKYRSVGHAVRVREGAATALHYLRTSRPQSIKCVTSQGSVLSSTLFTSEMDLPDATNDDKILSCCVHFCSDSTQRRPIRAGVRRLYREVVLLTEDRNLRVKAHARDVPVRDLLDFARWAGVR